MKRKRTDSLLGHCLQRAIRETPAEFRAGIREEDLRFIRIPTLFLCGSYFWRCTTPWVDSSVIRHRLFWCAAWLLGRLHRVPLTKNGALMVTIQEE